MTDDERFDLAKQMRIAETHRRVSQRLGDERVKRQRNWALVRFVALGIALIAAGLALTMTLVMR